MNVTQAEFTDFPFSLSEAAPESVTARFLRLTSEKGPLVPQVMLPAVLGVSKQRVHQFLATGRFEVFEFEGTKFVPLSEVTMHQPRVGGRPKVPK